MHLQVEPTAGCCQRRGGGDATPVVVRFQEAATKQEPDDISTNIRQAGVQYFEGRRERR